MTHWHIDKVTGSKTSVSGPVGDCCNGFATYDEAFGAADFRWPDIDVAGEEIERRWDEWEGES